MESDEPILASRTFEQQKVPEHLVAVVNLPQKMLSKPRASFGLAQGNIIFGHDMDGLGNRFLVLALGQTFLEGPRSV